VKGVCDRSGDGDRLIALRKADLSSADFRKGFGFAGEGCEEGIVFCDCDCEAFCVGEKISCEMGLLALNLSRLCSVRTESNLSLLSSHWRFGD
jgi:hypothetical protein